MTQCSDDRASVLAPSDHPLEAFEQPRIRLRLAVGLAPGLLVDGLGRADQWRRHERAGYPEHGSTDERRDHRRRRGQVHRPANDRRLDDVVLEVHVQDEGDCGDEGRRDALGRGQQDEERPAEEPADLGDQVGQHGPPRPAGQGIPSSRPSAST